ncbi:MAG: aromatic amino acid transport family protein [Parachlamydiaceae bacterium]
MESSTSKPVSTFRTLSASLLIAGTCIGGGMLALPISGGPVGFIPSLLVMLVCCIFMTFTGLMYLEATLWMKEKAHLNTLSAELLSPFWRVVCWVTYLFICYASLIAYMSGGGKEIIFVVNQLFDQSYENMLGICAFSLVFSMILFLGHRLVERTNTIMFFSMIFAYVMLIATSTGSINGPFLLRQEWNIHWFLLFPLMLTTFSFPGIVPTIVPYLDRNPRAVRQAIIFGTSIAFVVYFMWMFIVLGSVPHVGEHSLQEAFQCDIPATECLHYALNNPFLSAIAQFFAFFALSTSFLGISLSLFDFLRDTITVPMNAAVKKILFCIIVFAPSLLLAIYFERAFITALEMSGGIGDTVISGIIPVIMIWNGRYYLKKKGLYTVWGGKWLLVSIVVVSALIFFCEILRRILT